MAKLFTSTEDKGHIHAIVGFINLILYAWRYKCIFQGDLNVGFGRNASFDFISFLLMTMPSATSFLFHKHVPQENKGDGRIWKEYRIQNAVIAYSCLAMLAAKVYQMHHGPDSIPHLQVFKAVVMVLRLTGLWAGTYLFPPGKLSTIRGHYGHFPGWVRFFLSYAQFAGASIMILWDINAVFMFIGVSGIQTLSFVMTLRKKNKLSTLTLAAMYFIAIWAAVVYGMMPPLMQPPTITSPLDKRFEPFYMGLVTFMIRRQGLNRFACWIIGPALTHAAFWYIHQHGWDANMNVMAALSQVS